MKNEIILSIANKEIDITAALNLRKKVFVEEQGIPINMEIDGKDDRSIHIVALNNEKVVGTGRLTLENERGIISRIAVHKEYRSIGLGKKIILFLEQLAKDKQIQQLLLTPHKYLEKFYATLGYLEYGNTVKVGKHTLINMMKSI